MAGLPQRGPSRTSTKRDHTFLRPLVRRVTWMLDRAASGIRRENGDSLPLPEDNEPPNCPIEPFTFRTEPELSSHGPLSPLATATA